MCYKLQGICPSEANSCSGSQEFPQLLWNIKVQYCDHKSLPLPGQLEPCLTQAYCQFWDNLWPFHASCFSFQLLSCSTPLHSLTFRIQMLGWSVICPQTEKGTWGEERGIGGQRPGGLSSSIFRFGFGYTQL